MNSQSFFANVERHFQKAEYIAIRHLKFKMLSAPKALEQDSVRLYAFLSSGQRASASLLEELADYAKSVAFYKNSTASQKVYALCLFAKDEFSEGELQLFKKLNTHGGVTVIPAGYCVKDGSIIICDKAGILACAQTKKVLNLTQTIVK